MQCKFIFQYFIESGAQTDMSLVRVGFAQSKTFNTSKWASVALYIYISLKIAYIMYGPTKLNSTNIISTFFQI